MLLPIGTTKRGGETVKAFKSHELLGYRIFADGVTFAVHREISVNQFLIELFKPLQSKRTVAEK